ncbi:MAG: TfoX/Sxy family protein [Cardiobacteriaceae bacterium]|nr:TfoX/Sxy family protein [Cardiobacteriaceae bacterium]
MNDDSNLTSRIRAALSELNDVREIKMFGGLAFMLDARMLVCDSADGSNLLVRVAPEHDAEHLKRNGAIRAEMGKGRRMGAGWIRVTKDAIATDEDWQYWMDAAMTFHATASSKQKHKSKK